MFAAGQAVTNGQSIHTYNGTGTELHAFLIDANVANSQNQRTVLIGDSFPPNAVTSDFTDLALGTNIQPGSGAVCFTSTTFGPIGLDPLPNSSTPTETSCSTPKPPNTKLTKKPRSRTIDQSPARASFKVVKERR